MWRGREKEIAALVLGLCHLEWRNSLFDSINGIELLHLWSCLSGSVKKRVAAKEEGESKKKDGESTVISWLLLVCHNVTRAMSDGERKAGILSLTSSIGSATSISCYVEFLFVTSFVITATAAQVQMTLSYSWYRWVAMWSKCPMCGCTCVVIILLWLLFTGVLSHNWFLTEVLGSAGCRWR